MITPADLARMLGQTPDSTITFGDKQISDTQTTYVMKIPEGRLGDLIGPSQIQWARASMIRCIVSSSAAWISVEPSSTMHWYEGAPQFVPVPEIV